MVEIIKLHGTDAELYRLVAPLVMDPVVLKQNLGFPFRTTDKFVWFVAVEDGAVRGFVPVEIKKAEQKINNYYVCERTGDLLRQLLLETLGQIDAEVPVTAISFLQDVELFASLGFKETMRWTHYAKLTKEPKKQKPREKREEKNG